MQLGIVVAALRKHRLATFLIAIEIALACAVMCNAIFMVVERNRSLTIDSGVQEERLGIVQIFGVPAEAANDINALVVSALRSIPGVETVGVISAVPFGNPGVRAGVHLDEDLERNGGVLDFYLGDSAAITGMGLTIVAGREPDPTEYTPIFQYVPQNAPILVTKQLADRYWPGESALGKSIWAMDTRFSIIGVVEHLAVSQPGRGEALGNDWSIIVPAMAGPQLTGRYLVRGSAQEIPRIMSDASKAIVEVAPNIVFDYQGSLPVSELRDNYYRGTRLIVGLLVGIVVALLGATTLGIVGLASYWVDQRRKQIGIRRALGATRADVLRYFQIENFLIVSLGLIAGLVLAYAMNLGLMQLYELSRLPLGYLPITAVSLWLLGQAAVLLPAMRAASIDPVSAIRSS